MSTDPSGVKQLKRLGYRLPRKKLLPPYMSDPYFQEFGDIIDETYKELIDDKIAILSELRTGWHDNKQLESLILDEQMIDHSDWDHLERDLVAKQVNSLGLALSTGALDAMLLQNIARHVGFYWWERGTAGFLEFMNYCLGMNVTMKNMWAQLSLSIVRRRIRFTHTHEQPITGFIRFKDVTIGSFTNNPPGPINVTYIPTVYTPEGTNLLRLDGATWQTDSVQVQIVEPFSAYFDLQLF